MSIEYTKGVDFLDGPGLYWRISHWFNRPTFVVSSFEVLFVIPSGCEDWGKAVHYIFHILNTNGVA